jgi:hypothetical protein
MNDANTTQLLLMVSACGAFLGPIIITCFGLWIAQKQAAKVEQVKEKLATVTTDTNAKLNAIEQTGIKTHLLVNSRMGTVLGLYAAMAIRMADKTQEPVDIEVAKQAREMLTEHQGKQESADAVIQQRIDV